MIIFSVYSAKNPRADMDTTVEGKERTNMNRVKAKLFPSDSIWEKARASAAALPNLRDKRMDLEDE